jgi:hypothetical protein
LKTASWLQGKTKGRFLKKASQKLLQRKDENRPLFEKSFAKTFAEKRRKQGAF